MSEVFVLPFQQILGYCVPYAYPVLLEVGILYRYGNTLIHLIYNHQYWVILSYPAQQCHSSNSHLHLCHKAAQNTMSWC
jgi:hypothetical protein